MNENEMGDGCSDGRVHAQLCAKEKLGALLVARKLCSVVPLDLLVDEEQHDGPQQADDVHVPANVGKPERKVRVWSCCRRHGKEDDLSHDAVQVRRCEWKRGEGE